MKIHYKFTHYPSWDCDDCGSIFPTREELFFNDELVWYIYDDDHLSGSRTEEDSYISLINSIYDHQLSEHNLYYTESNRLIQLSQQVYSATTPEVWRTNANNTLQYLYDLKNQLIASMNYIKDAPHTYFTQKNLIRLLLVVCDELLSEDIVYTEEEVYE